MQLALNKAWEYQTLTLPNPSVGALVLKDGEILSIEAHKKANFPHAEVNALKTAYFKLTKDESILKLSSSQSIHEFLLSHHKGVFKDASIYVTLEPCNHYGKTPPCANLLNALGLKKVVIGTKDTNKIASGGMDTLQNIEVKTGILESKCLDLIKPFLTLKNTEKFTLFKLASRMDGSYKDGRVSNVYTHSFTHNQRSIAKSIIISGETLRKDKPSLDTRKADSFYKSTLPKIQILSTKPDTLNLTPYKDREIKVVDEVQKLDLVGFNVIEGGYHLLDTLKDRIDMLLVFIDPSFQTKSMSEYKHLNANFTILHSNLTDNNLITWLV
ncbi:riboflavin biosynthesis protein RibD [Helicobacter sp. 13S00401-1]|nr:riboflavin biosynthesis protein RibD [Helicobacter sp. 13S00401-1]